MSLKRTNHVHINNMIHEFESEKDRPFRQIHRMIDLFETIIKTHTSFIMGVYFKDKNIETNVKKMFANELLSPSLGKWQEFSRTLLYEIIIRKRITESEFEIVTGFLSSKKGNNLLSEFEKSYKKDNGAYQLVDRKNLDLKALRKIWSQNYDMVLNPLIVDDYTREFDDFNRKYMDEIIALRNNYAHGATPSDDKCKQDIEDFYGKLEILLNSKLFQSTTIAIYSEERNRFIPFEGKNFLSKNFVNSNPLYVDFSDEKITERQLYVIDEFGNAVCLFPMMILENSVDYKIDSFKIVFFNDMKRFYKHQEITYLNYPKAIRINDKYIKKDFLKITGLDETFNLRESKFQNIIDNKTENFLGREKTINELKYKIETLDKHFFMIFGVPGIGKSAFSANLYKHFVNYKDDNKVKIIEYFFGVNSQFNKSDFFLYSIFNNIDLIITSGKNNNTTKHYQYTYMEFNDKLIELSNYLYTNNEKVIFIIDGIDEAVDNNILEYLPINSYRNIYFVYTARETSKTRELWSNLDRENRTDIRLNPLCNDDIRAILYETVNKYDIIDNQNFVEIVAKRSNGNPLYLKMLCDSIYSGDIEVSVSGLETLPKGIEDFYEDFIYKINKNNDSKLIGTILQLMSIVKEPLSASHIEIILRCSEKRISEAEVDDTSIDKSLQRILDYLIVYRKHADTYEDAYSLYHETLREYITKKYKNPIINLKDTLNNYYIKWEDFSKYSKNIYEYPLKYYSNFLYEEGRFKELCSLTNNEKFSKAQSTIELGFMYTSNMYKEALEACSMIADHENMFNIAHRLLAFMNDRANKMINSLKLEDVSIDRFDEILDKYCDADSRISGKFLIEISNQIFNTESIDKSKYLFKVIDKYEKYSIKLFLDKNVSLCEVMDLLKRLNNNSTKASKVMISQIISQRIIFSDSNLMNNIKMNEIIEGLDGNKNSPYYFLNEFSFSDSNLSEICLFLARKSNYSKSIKYLNLIQNDGLRTRTTIEYIEIVLNNNDEEEAIRFKLDEVVKTSFLNIQIGCKIAEFSYQNGDTKKGLRLYNNLLDSGIAPILESDLSIIIDSLLKSSRIKVEPDILCRIKSLIYYFFENYKSEIEIDNCESINSRMPIILFLKASVLLQYKYKNEVVTLLKNIDLLLKKELKDEMGDESIIQYFEILSNAYQHKYLDVLQIIEAHQHFNRRSVFSYEMEEFIPILTEVLYGSSNKVISGIDDMIPAKIIASLESYDKYIILLIVVEKLKEMGKFEESIRISGHLLELIFSSDEYSIESMNEISTQIYLSLSECLIHLVDDLPIHSIRQVIELIADGDIRNELVINLLNKALIMGNDELAKQLKITQNRIINKPAYNESDRKLLENIMYSLGYNAYPINKIFLSNLQLNIEERFKYKNIFYLGMTNSGLFVNPDLEIDYDLKSIVDESLFCKFEELMLSNKCWDAKNTIGYMHFEINRLYNYFYLFVVLKIEKLEPSLQNELRKSITEIVKMSNKNLLEDDLPNNQWESEYELIQKIMNDSDDTLEVLVKNTNNVSQNIVDYLYYYVSKINLAIGNSSVAEKALNSIKHRKFKLLCLLDHFNYYEKRDVNITSQELIYKEILKVRNKYILNTEDDVYHFNREYVLLRVNLLIFKKEEQFEELLEYYKTLSDPSYVEKDVTYLRNNIFLNKYYFRDQVKKKIIGSESYIYMFNEIFDTINSGNYNYRDLTSNYQMIESKYYLLDALFEIVLNKETIDYFVDHITSENYNKHLKYSLFSSLTLNMDVVLNQFPEVFLKLIPRISNNYDSLRNCMTWYMVYRTINPQKSNRNFAIETSDIIPYSEIFQNMPVIE